MEASILLVCWNHEPYIRQCLESIFAQTNKDLEILFLDNVSTDRSFETAKAILEEAGFPFQIFRNETPLPITRNLNFLLEKASGTYVFPFSADDWMARDNIAEKVALLKSKPRVGLVFGGGWNFYADTDRYIEADISKFKRGDMTHNLLLDPASYFWAGPAYKRSVVLEMGKWDENLLIEDLDMNLRIAMKYEVDYVPKSLIYYRKHSSSFTGNHKLLLKGFKQYYKKYRSNKALPIKRWMAETYQKLSVMALENKDYKNTLKYLIRSVLLFPSMSAIKFIWAINKRFLYGIKPIQNVWIATKDFRQQVLRN